MYLSVCVHSQAFTTFCWNETSLRLPTSRFTGWLSDRPLECLQLHRLLFCVSVCVMHAELHVSYCHSVVFSGLLFVCLAPAVSPSTWNLSSVFP